MLKVIASLFFLAITMLHPAIGDDKNQTSASAEVVVKPGTINTELKLLEERLLNIENKISNQVYSANTSYNKASISSLSKEITQIQVQNTTFQTQLDGFKNIFNPITYSLIGILAALIAFVFGKSWWDLRSFKEEYEGFFNQEKIRSEKAFSSLLDEFQKKFDLKKEEITIYSKKIDSLGSSVSESTIKVRELRSDVREYFSEVDEVKDSIEELIREHCKNIESECSLKIKSILKDTTGEPNNTAIEDREKSTVSLTETTEVKSSNPWSKK